eukprot:TRINITY_DN16188_c0_g1_i1.p1 TRINITY_DN16188_c0_g1~~TRINITY_DN16188_c0_g1_i1.p1  ORF type:complete len:378 (+),score=58.36 TRINITY_DN16188_c0_g1_i1:52-1134(+)
MQKRNNKQKGGAKRKPGAQRSDNSGAPPARPTEVPRFDVEDPAAYQYLEENGYVVIKDVLTPDEIEKGRGLAWDFMEGRPDSAIKRNDPATWTDESGWPDKYGKGIIVEDAAGHSEFLWFVRGVPNVQRVYQRVWDTENLITSYDGFCMFRPAEYNDKWLTATGWYHIDQNGITKPSKTCVQGFVNFYDAGPTDGGLVVVPKSPTIFNSLFKNPAYAKSGDFVRMQNAVWSYEAAALSPIKVCAKAGDMVLWDSRTIHCNTPPTTFRPIPADGSVLPLRRLVAYVCMTPASRLTPELIYQRQNAYEFGHTSTHWPEECNVAGRTNHSKRAYKKVPLSASQRALIPLYDEETENADNHQGH